MDVDQQVRALDRSTLVPLVRQVLGHDADLVTWDHRRIPHLLGDAALSRVYRLAGAARVRGETRPWSLILKALTRPPDPAAPGWDREIAAFRSGLLEDLPRGLAAPRCYAIEERPEAVWLWQEDVAEEGDARWPPARFALAARHLGRFSGRSLVAGPLPDAPWLGRGRLRGSVDRNADFWDGRIPVRDPALLDRLFPDGLLDRARRVWDERYRLLDTLDRLPQTLVHGDADRRNLFARRDRDGEDETVAIDWAWMGVAALGDDLVDLVAGSALWFQADPRDLPALAEACLAGYGAGLADAGWPGDARLARIGFAIGATLHYGPCGPFVFRLRYPEVAEALARAEGRGPYEIVDRMAVVQRFALDRLDAVRGDIAAL